MLRFTLRGLRAIIRVAPIAIAALICCFAAEAEADSSSKRSGIARTQRADGLKFLGRRAPRVAHRHRMSSGELRVRLRRDSLWVDEMDRLLYIDEPHQTGPAAQSAPAIPSSISLADAFSLHSNPTSPNKLFLDFDGHFVASSAWGTNVPGVPYDLDGSPGTFSDSERSLIIDIWRRVAEDYLPFNIDITTEAPAKAGSHVVITRTNGVCSQCGGIAYVGIFNQQSPNAFFSPTAWVFIDALNPYSSKNIAEAVSHEAGHNLGLNHDGQNPTAPNQNPNYYAGHGSGETSWSPIMGVGYYTNVSQWSRGQYTNATNLQDDVVRIAGFVGMRPDDVGDTTGGAFVIAPTTSISVSGIIGSATDVDVYRFQSGTGQLVLSVAPVASGPNLKVKAQLISGEGQAITSDPADQLSANYNLAVTAGTYYLIIEGTGARTPIDGFSDYGSMGQYTLTGTIPNPGSVTPIPTSTHTVTSTPTNTATRTPTNTPTNTPSNTPTNTQTNTPTSTPTNTPTRTPTSTSTNTPVNTPSRTPTTAATATNTPPVVATSTRTSTPLPATPTPPPATPTPPSATPTVEPPNLTPTPIPAGTTTPHSPPPPGVSPTAIPGGPPGNPREHRRWKSAFNFNADSFDDVFFSNGSSYQIALSTERAVGSGAVIQGSLLNGAVAVGAVLTQSDRSELMAAGREGDLIRWEQRSIEGQVNLSGLFGEKKDKPIVGCQSGFTPVPAVYRVERRNPKGKSPRWITTVRFLSAGDTFPVMRIEGQAVSAFCTFGDGTSDTEIVFTMKNAAGLQLRSRTLSGQAGGISSARIPHSKKPVFTFTLPKRDAAPGFAGVVTFSGGKNHLYLLDPGASWGGWTEIPFSKEAAAFEVSNIAVGNHAQNYGWLALISRAGLTSWMMLPLQP